MKYLWFIITFFSFQCVGNEVLIYQQGERLPVIVLENYEDEVLDFAADELTQYLKRLTGERFVVTNQASETFSIILKKTNNPQLKWDGYAINVQNSSITISSNTPRGVLYGVYDLLKQWGCSFVFPGEVNQYVPSNLKRLSLAQGEKIKNPQLEFRGLSLMKIHNGNRPLLVDILDWMAKNRFNYVMGSPRRDNTLPDEYEEQMMNFADIYDHLIPNLSKRGLIYSSSEHNTSLLFPDSLFEKDPTLFAKYQGKQNAGNQINYSNPQAIEIYTQQVLEFIKDKKHIAFVGTWGRDGGKGYGDDTLADPNLIIKAIAKMATKIGKVRPDVNIEFLAYTKHNTTAPDFELPKNMSVLYCPNLKPGDKNRSENLKKWVDAAKNAQGVNKFEYRTADNWRLHGNTTVLPEFAANLVKEHVQSGVRGMISLYLPTDSWFRASMNFAFIQHETWEGEGDGMNRSETIKQLSHLLNTEFPYYGSELSGLWENIIYNVNRNRFHLIYARLTAEYDINVIKSAGDTLLNMIKLKQAISGDNRLNVVEKVRYKRHLNQLAVYLEYMQYDSAYSITLDDKELNKLHQFVRAKRPQYPEVLLHPAWLQWRLKQSRKTKKRKMAEQNKHMLLSAEDMNVINSLKLYKLEVNH